MIETYTRGTKTTRVKTARLTSGQRVLTEPATRWVTNDAGNFVTYMQPNGLMGVVSEPVGEGFVQAAQTKTGSIVRTVHHLEAIRVDGGRRAQRQYTVHFVDGTKSEGNAPIYTWHGVQ